MGDALQNHTGRVYIAPCWHRAIEVSFTVQGSIDDFTIGNRHFKTKAGQNLVVNSQVIHSVDSFNTPADSGLAIIFPYRYVAGLFPQINKYKIQLNDPHQFTIKQKNVYVELQSLLGKAVLAIRNTNDQYWYVDLAMISNQILANLLHNFLVKESPCLIIDCKD